MELKISILEQTESQMKSVMSKKEFFLFVPCPFQQNILYIEAIYEVYHLILRSVQLGNLHRAVKFYILLEAMTQHFLNISEQTCQNLTKKILISS